MKLALTTVLVFFFAVTVYAGSPSPEKLTAVNLLRLINTAEMEYRASHKGFGTFKDLVASGQLEKTARRMKSTVYDSLKLNSETNALEGAKLSVTVSPDGRTYSIALKQRDADCGFNLFSDEGGIIYHGKPLDCRD